MRPSTRPTAGARHAAPQPMTPSNPAPVPAPTPAPVPSSGPASTPQPTTPPPGAPGRPRDPHDIHPVLRRASAPPAALDLLADRDLAGLLVEDVVALDGVLEDAMRPMVDGTATGKFLVDPQAVGS